MVPVALDAPDDGLQKLLDLTIAGCWQFVEDDSAAISGNEHAVHDQEVSMNMQVRGGAKSLNERDRACLTIRNAACPCTSTIE